MKSLPDWVRDSARSLLGLVDRDVPLAELTFDSVLDDPDTDPTAPRRLRFASAGGVVNIDVSLHGSSPQLMAELKITPPRQYNVVIQHKSAPAVKATTDEGGAVRIPILDGGLTALHVSPSGSDSEPACRTAWVVY